MKTALEELMLMSKSQTISFTFVAATVAACILLLVPRAGYSMPVDEVIQAPGWQDRAEAATNVVLETTRGDIVLAVHHEWSPLGAEHFIELVDTGFYDGAPWFRVIDGFVAQCGISADPAMNTEWGERTFEDEPVIQGNLPGFVAFGKSSMPNSRSTHIYINYADNSSNLDPQGFSCFAEVIEGLDVALELHRCEWYDQGGLARKGGLGRFKEAHPEADYITKAVVER
jgi:peptidyl-prolyl cis-trans isomerase A (cyclophilin A)